MIWRSWQQAFQSSKICGTEGRNSHKAPPKHKYATCKSGVRVSGQRLKKKSGQKQEDSLQELPRKKKQTRVHHHQSNCKESTCMNTSNMFFILLQTGRQRRHLSQTREADQGRSRMSTEMEQMEECHNTRMEELENKERWLNSVMLKGSSWCTARTLFAERVAELGVFSGIEHRLRGEAADQEMECVREERLHNCRGSCTQHQRSRRWEVHFGRSDDCCQKEVASVGDTTAGKVDGL